MAIIARRIPSGLGYISAHTVPAHTVRGGLGSLGGAESCGPDQQYDPNYIFGGIKGQCVPKGQPLVQMATTPQPGDMERFMKGLVGRKPSPVPLPGGATVPARRGMSRNTMIAVGLGAVGLVAFAMFAPRKKK